MYEMQSYWYFLVLKYNVLLACQYVPQQCTTVIESVQISLTLINKFLSARSNHQIVCEIFFTNIYTVSQLKVFCNRDRKEKNFGIDYFLAY